MMRSRISALSGFTLIELMIVVAIMLSLLSVKPIFLEGWLALPEVDLILILEIHLQNMFKVC